MEPPASLEEGDRWFVSFVPALAPGPMAERSRQRRTAGVLVEEVTWGRSFAEVASAVHGTAQVSALVLDDAGLRRGLVDGSGRVVGEPWLEVAAPLRVGNRWRVAGPGGGVLHGEIEALEEVETPAGRVRALRVAIRRPSAEPMTQTTWYDAGLRRVRAEVRRFGGGELVEARAALASPEPTPEECRAALDWALDHLTR
jgi:hypothetical protein